MTMTPIDRPNIFDYATSELSQDAMICWLLRWADPRYRESSLALHATGRALLENIGRKCKTKVLPESIQSVKPVRGKQNMDIVCHLNGDDAATHTAILIEDKTGTGEHGNQLHRYRRLIGKELPEDRILPVYLKTGDQSRTSLRKIEDRGNAIVLRKDLLALLEGRKEARAVSDVLDDFVHSLRKRENRVQFWQTKSPDGGCHDCSRELAGDGGGWPAGSRGHGGQYPQVPHDSAGKHTVSDVSV